MSSWTPPGPGPDPLADPAPTPGQSYPGQGYPPLPHLSTEPAAGPSAEAVQDAAISAGIVLAWFVALGAIGAVVWDKVVTLPEFTRVATNGSMGEEQLSHQFSISGWFLVIGFVGGLVSGALLLALRRKNPVAMVVLVALGGVVATYVMLWVGLSLGPPNPDTVLGAAKLGDKVPVQLKPDVNAIYFVWSVAALFGAMFSMWILETASGSRRRGGGEPPSATPYYG